MASVCGAAAVPPRGSGENEGRPRHTCNDAPDISGATINNYTLENQQRREGAHHSMPDGECHDLDSSPSKESASSKEGSDDRVSDLRAWLGLSIAPCKAFRRVM